MGCSNFLNQSEPGADVIELLWLDVPSHMTIFNQWERIIYHYA